MSADSAKDKRIREQASEWVIELSAPHATDATMDAFERWYRADPRHARAFEHASRGFLALAQVDDPDLLALADPDASHTNAYLHVTDWWSRAVSSWRPYWSLAVAISAITTVGIAWVLVQSSPEPARTQDYRTGIAEVRTIELEDGSIVTLGARSHIRMHFETNARLVTLGGGQAFFSVSKDPIRPFIVKSGDTQVRVTGTKFDLHKGPSGLRVAVEEGAVEVSVRPTLPVTGRVTATKQHRSSPAGAVGLKAILFAGQQVVARNNGKLEDIEPTSSIVPPSAWRSGWLAYSNSQLAELVADLNRYYDGTITLSSESVGNIRFSGVFSTSDADTLVESLPRYLPVELDRQSNKEIIVRLPKTGRDDK